MISRTLQILQMQTRLRIRYYEYGPVMASMGTKVNEPFLHSLVRWYTSWICTCHPCLIPPKYPPRKRSHTPPNGKRKMKNSKVPAGKRISFEGGTWRIIPFSK